MSHKIWLEAANFDDHGGWHLDTQYVHKMGSPYLLAPFLEGKPAVDAKTNIKVPAKGRYALWVRSRNWVQGHAPGRFTVTLDGVKTDEVFGQADSSSWVWTRGGHFELDGGNCAVSLNDLTGWFSRFNALVLTDDEGYEPPDDLEGLRQERMVSLGRTPEVQSGGEFDFVVVGGGPGGFPAALQAARLGLRTLVIHDRPVLGGNASPEIEVPFDGASSRQLYARETGICEEIFWMRRNTGKNYDQIFRELAEPLDNLKIVVNQRVLSAETSDGDGKGRRIKSVTARDVLTGVETRYSGTLFLDGTGDGWLGEFSGAELMFGREAASQFKETMAPEKADGMTMSGCLRGPFGPERIIKRDRPVPFETPAWIEPFGPELESYRSIPGVSAFQWWLEHSNDWDDVAQPEECRDELIRIVVGYWDFLKNTWSRKGEAANWEMNYIPFINGRREGSRLVGDYVLCEEDCRTGKSFEDNIAYAGWPIDIHHPLGIHSGDEGPFFSNMDVPLVKIPYRCLYSRNVENLLMAGRNVSVTHIALGTVRVEATCAVMGQAAGVAAALCVKKGTTPRGIYRSHLEELQQLCLKQDLYIPEVKHRDPADKALTASASASSTHKWEIFSREKGWAGGWPQLGDCKRAVFFPLEVETKINSLYLKLQNRSNEPRELTGHVFESDAPGVFATNSPICETKGVISSHAEAWVEFPVNREFAMKYAWAYLDEAEDVFIQRMTGGKLDTYLAWKHPWNEDWHIPPRHEYYAYRLEKPEIEYAAGDAGQVNNGWGRAIDPERYMWVSGDNSYLPQWLRLDWEAPQTFNTVHLIFDTDLNNPAMDGKGNTKTSPFSVSDYEVQVLDGEDGSGQGRWRTLVEVWDNFHRRRVHRFKEEISRALRLVVKNMNGCYQARVYEIRVYAD